MFIQLHCVSEPYSSLLLGSRLNTGLARALAHSMGERTTSIAMYRLVPAHAHAELAPQHHT